MKTILFVCTGNVCRSPMAEGLFRHALSGRGDYRVLSAGLGAVDGQPPSTFAIQAMRELGIDISQQRSRMLTAEVVRQADFIFGMTHNHVDTVTLLYPQVADKTFLLREFDETLDPYEKDISDPIGGSYEVYINCRDQIEQGIASLLGFLGQTETSRISKAVAAGQTATVALGADHGGFELKEALKKHLQARKVSFTDFGTHSKESTDYPDYAQLVAQCVASAKAQYGVLVCTTGVGMSIAANKVPGVRAAMVCDPQAAALTRQHNDANILCLSGKFTSPEEAQKILDTFMSAQFEGGRHERRVQKMDPHATPPALGLR